MVPDADVVVSMNFATLIPEWFLQKFEHGVLNSHAGNLPRYRGNACPNWAIINGEEEVYVTIHVMAKELDAGPILSQSKMRLTQHTYIGEVDDWLTKTVPP